MSVQTTGPSSPKWNATTKQVVALTLVAFTLALLIYFHTLLGPVILAFILAFVLHPVAARFSAITRITWRTSVNLIYLVFIIILIGLITIAGLALVQQIQTLIVVIEAFITNLPRLVSGLSQQVYRIGPFTINMAQFELTTLVEQALRLVQPLFGQVGGLISRFATSAASTLAWTSFVILVSYFLLAEGGQFRENLLHIDIPGYSEDARRLTRELGNIWDAFLRGQLVIILLVVIMYSIMLTILGTRLSLAIALLAGIARLLPYIGPLITWTVTGMVAFLQTGNYFGLEPWKYTILVIASCLIMDQIFDNLVSPRILGQTLGVHPAGVLIAAIVATNLIGLVGLVLAAPSLATLNLLGRYVLRKMFDLDPWPLPDTSLAVKEPAWEKIRCRLRALWRLVNRQRP
jgi:predicted PurR-regulated permease PerM